MSAGLLQCLGHLHVVLQVVLGARTVEEVAGVADGGFADGAGFNHRIHRHAHVVDAVERVEHAEDIDAVLGRLLHKVFDDVVSVVGVTDRIGRTQQHLDRDIGDGCAQHGEAFPGIFLEEAHGDVEGRAAPAFQREKLRRQTGVIRRDGRHVGGAHARGKQGLVRVAHGGVGEKNFLLRLQPLRETGSATLLQFITHAARQGRG